MIDIQGSLSNNNLGLYNKQTHYIKRGVIAQNNSAAKMNEEVSTSSQSKRETYGLAILELMSDQEYQAWLRATAGMSEAEKMLAVQKLYPLADIEKLKSKKLALAENSLVQQERANRENKAVQPFIINANKLNGMKVFNANSDFVQRYKNALENISIEVALNG
ncbi:hypothetical protein LS73_002525 [Helicobacter muridarum]|uniref:Uncharacterized protein n=1 Tax=Helicobacter muridarum TaxID=216 RepID=A0A377PST7_9HELI|nr:hypothetical protein [Helicobacter muridarum]TLE01165.1 hypothetical protein LS73_002525 [Helicobacter muridarum]STQ86038.1 Uncharacterised protein [Helicobacter muridarum]